MWLHGDLSKWIPVPGSHGIFNTFLSGHQASDFCVYSRHGNIAPYPTRFALDVCQCNKEYKHLICATFGCALFCCGCINVYWGFMCLPISFRVLFTNNGYLYDYPRSGELTISNIPVGILITSPQENTLEQCANRIHIYRDVFVFDTCSDVESNDNTT